MLKNTRLLAVAFMGLGVLLGYAAASGKLKLIQWVRAGQPPTSEQPSGAQERQAGCCDGVSKEQLIAERLDEVVEGRLSPYQLAAEVLDGLKQGERI